MTKKTTKKNEAIEPKVVTDDIKDTQLVTFSIDKLKQKYGFMPTSIHIADKVISEQSLTVEVDKEYLKSIQDLIVG